MRRVPKKWNIDKPTGYFKFQLRRLWRRLTKVNTVKEVAEEIVTLHEKGELES